MNISNIKSDIDFLCGSTSGTYPDADKIRNVNIAYHDVARIIWEADGDWAFDDKNNTDTPRAYRTLANASGTYLVPTTALRIEGVEVKDANGDWYKLRPISYHDIQISPEEFLTGGGLPMYYRLEGNEISLYPAPATNYTTMTSGLMVRLSRSVNEIPTTATTTEPGFASPFHRILSYSAALDFEQSPNSRNFLAAQKARLESGLTNFYSKRAEEYKSKIKPASKKRWRIYT